MCRETDEYLHSEAEYWDYIREKSGENSIGEDTMEIVHIIFDNLVAYAIEKDNPVRSLKRYRKRSIYAVAEKFYKRDKSWEDVLFKLDNIPDEEYEEANKIFHALIERKIKEMEGFE